jgi:hypothetical protein
MTPMSLFLNSAPSRTVRAIAPLIQGMVEFSCVRLMLCKVMANTLLGL